MQFQVQIDDILSSDAEKEEKKAVLKQLFQSFSGGFSDFDDTLTDEISLLYSKLKWLKRQGKSFDRAFLERHLHLHLGAVEELRRAHISQLIIISRNDIQLLKLFSEMYGERLKKEGIVLQGVVGSLPTFSLTLQDKIDLLSAGSSWYLCDVFEWKRVTVVLPAICVESYSLQRLFKKYLYKLFYFSLFLLK
ncbi:MAG: hypothetical protein LBG52_00270 [Candidatus Peribacteria bacterium]|jgi:hypothetical protein|nr:hypothetical protein [Candidatus Peribacteria bacterium]